MSGDDLSLEAKAAIQAYIFKLALPSGTAIAIVSGLVGYVLSGIARIDASEEAAKQALFAWQSAVKAEALASTASEQAVKSLDEANVASEKAKNAASRSEETLNSLRSSRDQINNVLSGKYEELAKALFETRGFRESIATIPQREISDLKRQIEQIESSIFGSADPAVPAPGGVCPSGTYAVVVRSVSAPGGRAGFVESISVQCRTIRFERPK